MFLNIITPCVRPENLLKISKSINIPKRNYRWVVVCDSEDLPQKSLIPENCEIYIHKNKYSVSGNDQRNFALDLIKEGYTYFNDDDTIIHPELWSNVKNLTEDFIIFHQENKFGKIRLTGEIGVGKIDSHNFIVNRNTIGNTRFILEKYDSDGYFATECYEKSKTFIKLDIVLSTYNFLNHTKH